MPFLFIFLIGVLYRIAYFVHSINCLPVSTDEACVGLMAKHILKGEFPLIYWGVGYQGPLDAYLNVPVFLFFSPSCFSMRILTLIGSILFLLLIYILGKNIFNKQVGLLSMLFIAIPPAYLAIAGATAISPYNYYILTAGTLILILAHRLIYFGLKGIKQIVYFVILGFLSGIMFWFHMVIIYYLITVIVFLFLKDKLFFIRKSTFVGFIFFCIGSLPLWIYNFRHNFSSFALGRSVPLPAMFEKLKGLFSFTLPAILGFHVPMYIDNTNFIHLPDILGTLYALVLIVLFICALILSLKETTGIKMLLFFLLVVFLVFSKTDRANWWALRYIEPIFSVIPVLLAFAVYKISRYSKVFAGACFGVILFVNLYGGIKIYNVWSDKKTVEETLELPDISCLVDFLRKEGINRAFSHYWTAYRITFSTNEEIIVSPPYDERFGQFTPPYLSAVENSSSPAYISSKGLGVQENQFEGWLKNINGEYNKRVMEYFTVFYSFAPPFGKIEPKIIERSLWQVSSNFKQSDVKYAIDGDIKTRWGSGAPQSSGMCFLIDLGKIYEICKIRCDLGIFETDLPRGYIVYISEDKNDWQKVAETQGTHNGLFWGDRYPKYFMGDYFNICFIPVKARYIKIIQTAEDPRFDWSIAEINVYNM